MEVDETTTRSTNIVTLSAKVYESDRTDILEYAKKFPNVRDGFTDIVARIQGKPETIYVDVPKETNLADVFELSTYEAFIDPTDTNVSDAIKRALEVANTNLDTIQQEVEKAKLNITGRHLELTPEMDHKASVLFRFLKSKGKIPQDATEKEYYEKLFEKLLTRHIDNNFDFLNKE